MPRWRAISFDSVSLPARSKNGLHVVPYSSLSVLRRRAAAALLDRLGVDVDHVPLRLQREQEQEEFHRR
jgi:hypothetical protein